MRAHVKLKTEVPFYKVFPEGKAPVKSAEPITVNLHELGPTKVFMLDVNAITPSQLREIIDVCSRLFRASASDIMGQIMEAGMPIRESQIDSVEAYAIELRQVV